jgi:hypothetical protein
MKTSSTMPLEFITKPAMFWLEVTPSRSSDGVVLQETTTGLPPTLGAQTGEKTVSSKSDTENVELMTKCGVAHQTYLLLHSPSDLTLRSHSNYFIKFQKNFTEKKKKKKK